ncbi:MAG TPA: hypothetical protein VGM23_09045, partial [Armatimonadota bacterium]
MVTESENNRRRARRNNKPSVQIENGEKDTPVFSLLLELASPNNLAKKLGNVLGIIGKIKSKSLRRVLCVALGIAVVIVVITKVAPAALPMVLKSFQNSILNFTEKPNPDIPITINPPKEEGIDNIDEGKKESSAP